MRQETLVKVRSLLLCVAWASQSHFEFRGSCCSGVGEPRRVGERSAFRAALLCVEPLRSILGQA